MLINDHVYRAAQDAENHMVTVLHACYVMKQHDKKGEAKRILILSDSSICFYKDGINPYQDRTMYWPDLSSVSVSPGRIDLIFGSKKLFRFTTPEFDEIAQKIMEILKCSMTPQELQMVQCPELLSEESSVNGWGVLARFRSNCLKMGTPIDGKAMSLLFRSIELQETILNISSLQTSDSVLPILISIAALPKIESIVLPKSSSRESIFSVLTKFFQTESSKLIHIFINDKASKEFAAFCASVCLKSSSSITGLSFSGASFSKENLQSLFETAALKSLFSLSLQSSFPSSIFPFFYDSFLAPPLTDHLLMLNLDTTLGLNLPHLLKKIPNIASLSLANCGLEISEAIRSISASGMQRIRFLNLSSNHCSFPPDSGLILPCSLQRIDIGSVDFIEGMLPPFINFLLRVNWLAGLRLYCPNLPPISDSDLVFLNDVFDNATKFQIIEFSWSGNQITENLLSFVKKCKHLTSLYLSCCSFSTNELVKLCYILPFLGQLTTFVIRGSEGKVLGKEAPQLIRSLRNMRSLQYLDISYNLIGDEGVSSLSDLIGEVPSLSAIYFDGSEFKNLSTISNLIGVIESKGAQLIVGWPIKDLALLPPFDISSLKRRIQSVAGLETQSASYRRMSNCSAPYSQFILPVSSSSFALKVPLEVFSPTKNDTFPLYVTELFRMQLTGINEVLEGSSSYYSEESETDASNSQVTENELISFGQQKLPFMVPSQRTDFLPVDASEEANVASKDSYYVPAHATASGYLADIFRSGDKS